ncbi:MAG: hypothetical protein OEZ06_32840 [Myxococcales bacterium]|nr:hypothetical protein [Myxococcales bacterium]
MSSILSSDNRYEIKICTSPDSPGLAQALGEVVQLFAAGLRFGMLPPAQLSGPVEMNVVEPCLTVEMSLTQCTSEALSVLTGMVEFHRGRGLPIDSVAITSPNGRENQVAKERSPIPADLPFKLLLDLPPINRPLVILVDFTTGVSDEVREEVCSLFMVWAAMVCGGYPPSGSEAGASGLGAGLARFLHPSLLEYSTETWHAAPECLTPILRSLQALHIECPITAVEVQ